MIAILSGIKVGLRSDSAPDTGVPLRWVVLSVWRREPGDERKQYEQRIQVLSPSSRPLLEAVVPCDFAGTTKTHRLKTAIDGFPVSESGEYEVRLAYRELPESEWKNVGEYPIDVGHTEPASM